MLRADSIRVLLGGHLAVDGISLDVRPGEARARPQWRWEIDAAAGAVRAPANPC